MRAPAPIAAWTASWPEWKYVPSPKFCTTCSVSTNGLIPIQWAPSLPIAVMPNVSPTVAGSMSRLMPWQPVPAPTRVPSGTLVPQLCGQPEQKNGVRWVASGSSEPTSMRSRGGGASRSARRRDSRERSASTMASASMRPYSWNSSAPVSSCLPTMRGRSAVS